MCTPVIHARYGLECPCMTKRNTYVSRQTPPIENKGTMSQTLTPREKYLMEQKPPSIPFSEESFVIDWKDWIRHSWNITNFYGNNPLTVSGERVSGFNLSFGFVNRLHQIVNENKALVVQGFQKSKFIISFNEPMTVQFAVLSLSDRITVTADDAFPVVTNFALGSKVKFNGKEFAGNPTVQDHEGVCDLLFKFINVKNVTIVFNNRIVISDILYKV